MSAENSKLGIIAGGGELPFEVARAAARVGKKPFVLAIDEFAEAVPDDFDSARNAMSKMGGSIRILKKRGCTDLVFAGSFARPRDRNIRLRPDFGGLMFLVSNFGVLRRTNDGIHRAIATTFERHGFRVRSPLDAAPELGALEGYLTQTHANPEMEANFAGAIAADKRHGETGQGQAIVLSGEAVMASEARSGTDAMLASLPRSDGRESYLVKAMAPNQLPTMDPPAIGKHTVELAARAGLAGIVVEAGNSIIVRPEIVKHAADAAGLFVIGVRPS